MSVRLRDLLIPALLLLACVAAVAYLYATEPVEAQEGGPVTDDATAAYPTPPPPTSIPEATPATPVQGAPTFTG